MRTGRPLRDPQLSRRDFLAGSLLAGSLLSRGGAAAVTLFVPRRSTAQPDANDAARLSAAARSAARASPLIYVSPLTRDGSESRCHGEVWFAMDGDDLLVVTDPSRWRAAAIAKGLDQARIWVGDYGVWKRAEGRFRRAPSFIAMASLESDGGAQARALAEFGKKYSDEWAKWGPRFEKGLASGKRVMIRYHPE